MWPELNPILRPPLEPAQCLGGGSGAYMWPSGPFVATGSVTAELPRVPTAETSEGTEDEHVNIDTCLEAEERELERKHQEQLERLQSYGFCASRGVNAFDVI